MLNKQIFLFLVTLCLLVISCHAVDLNHSPEPEAPSLELTRQEAMKQLMNTAITSTKRHFNLLPDHLGPNMHWVDTPYHNDALRGLLRDPSSRFVQLNRDGDWRLFAAPWRTTLPGQWREKNYVTYLYVNERQGVLPMGYSEFKQGNLLGRPYDFWAALRGEARITQSEMLRRFPHLAHF